jgi:hypothetical protein
MAGRKDRKDRTERRKAGTIAGRKEGRKDKTERRKAGTMAGRKEGRKEGQDRTGLKEGKQEQWPEERKEGQEGQD